MDSICWKICRLKHKFFENVGSDRLFFFIGGDKSLIPPLVLISSNQSTIIWLSTKSFDIFNSCEGEHKYIDLSFIRLTVLSWYEYKCNVMKSIACGVDTISQ